MKNHFLVVLYAFISITVSSCDSGDSKSNLIIKDVIPMDVANDSDTSDIFVRTIFSEQVTSTYKYFISKNTNSDETTIDFLKGLSSDRFTTAPESTSVRLSIRLQEGQLDTDGDAIKESVNYRIFVLNEGEKVISEPSKYIKLSDAGPLNGKYSGLWNDNIYSSFGITARLAGAGDNYSGPFFYSNGLPNFTPCCGGSDDGSISIVLNGTEITDFTYNQNFKTYMGGCPGTYNGSGSLDGVTSILIDFTGNDCDGTHTGGKIELSRIE